MERTYRSDSNVRRPRPVAKLRRWLPAAASPRALQPRAARQLCQLGLPMLTGCAVLAISPQTFDYVFDAGRFQVPAGQTCMVVAVTYEVQTAEAFVDHASEGHDRPSAIAGEPSPRPIPFIPTGSMFAPHCAHCAQTSRGLGVAIHSLCLHLPGADHLTGRAGFQSSPSFWAAWK